MGELEKGVATGSTPTTTRSNDLLPVSVKKVKQFLEGKDSDVIEWIVKVVEILNYHALGMKPRLGAADLTPAQELMVTRLLESAKRFVNHGGSVKAFDVGTRELSTAKFDYSGEPLQYMQELVADKIIPCWPKIGEAAIQDATDFVSPVVRDPIDWIRQKSSLDIFLENRSIWRKYIYLSFVEDSLFFYLF